MTWKKGESGNPGGRGERQFADALRAAVNTECPKRKRGRLQVIAETVVELAMQGESWAVAQVADRLDGKPAQETHVTYEKFDASDWSRDELVALINDIRKGSGATHSPNGRGNGSDPIH